MSEWCPVPPEKLRFFCSPFSSWSLRVSVCFCPTRALHVRSLLLVLWPVAVSIVDLPPSGTVPCVRHCPLGFCGSSAQRETRTACKVMIGELTAQKGSVTVNRNMRIALFAQHHVDTLDLKNTCIESVQSRFPGLPDQEVRNMLGRFGIQGDMALRRIKTLSGGQKSRVALTIITQCQPHMIVLDEPTNHLDMESIDSLIEAHGSESQYSIAKRHCFDIHFVHLVSSVQTSRHAQPYYTLLQPQFVPPLRSQFTPHTQPNHSHRRPHLTNSLCHLGRSSRHAQPQYVDHT